MSVVSALIDAARKRAGIASDSALAAHFGVHRQAVSKWRNGDAYPDEDHIAEMAEMAGDDPVQWLVAIKATRSHGAAGKAWAALAKRLTATALAVVLTFGAIAANFSEKTYASTAYAESISGNTVYYVLKKCSPDARFLALPSNSRLALVWQTGRALFGPNRAPAAPDPHLTAVIL